jgi:hypothetical protein
MFKAIRSTSTIAILTLVTAACAQPAKEDPRVAELQKELAAAKQELATKSPDSAATAAPPASELAPAAAVPVERAAPPAAPPASRATPDQSANARKATDKLVADQQKVLAEQQKGLDEQQKGLAAQQAASARQAEENAKLRRELDAMKPREFTLPAGTPIAVRTTAELSTKSVKNGSVFDALLERDLVIDGATLAKAGSRVACIVVSSDPGGRVKGVASLSVAARSIAGVDANTLTVKTNSYNVEAGTTKGKDAARTGIATGAGAVIGAIAGGGKGAAIGAGVGAAAGVGGNMATRGAAAVIPTETLIEFTLAAPATVVLRK